MNHARRFQFLFTIYLDYRLRYTCVCNYDLCSLLVSRGLEAPNGRGPRFLEPAEPAIATPLLLRCCGSNQLNLKAMLLNAEIY